MATVSQHGSLRDRTLLIVALHTGLRGAHGTRLARHDTALCPRYSAGPPASRRDHCVDLASQNLPQIACRHLSQGASSGQGACLGSAGIQVFKLT